MSVVLTDTSTERKFTDFAKMVGLFLHFTVTVFRSLFRYSLCSICSCANIQLTSSSALIRLEIQTSPSYILVPAWPVKKLEPRNSRFWEL